jgi:hypothetical protein
MQGYLIEFDKNNLTWTWNKWEYSTGTQGEKRVIRRSGSLEFMKMLPSVFDGKKEHTSSPTPIPSPIPSPIRNQEEMDKTLDKNGVSFVFLFQGQTREETRFKTTKEAEEFHELNSYPSWDLTDYWFGFDNRMRSWAMYDTYTGNMEFTPRTAEERIAARPIPGFLLSETQKNRTGYTFH